LRGVHAEALADALNDLAKDTSIDRRVVEEPEGIYGVVRVALRRTHEPEVVTLTASGDESRVSPGGATLDIPLEHVAGFAEGLTASLRLLGDD
jgi:hypothetical protein